MVCVQTNSEKMASGLGVVRRSGIFQLRRWWSRRMLQRIVVSGSYVVGWGRGWMHGRLCWVFLGRVWGRRRHFGIRIVFYLAWMLSAYQIGGSVPTFMSEVKIGLTIGLQPLSEVKLEWWDGFVVVDVRRFESTMVLSAIWCSDRATIVCKLLVINGLLV